MVVIYKNLSEEKRKNVIRRLRDFFEDYNEIIFAYIHGSFAEGYPFRDIDIAIYIDERVVPMDNAIDYGLDISARTEIITGILPLDVKVINYVPVGFQFYVTKGQLLFSKDEEIRCEFLERTWKRYFDLLPKRRQILLDLVSA
ncbi:MAG TPA: nucleotidyltransferase domain-containing protein [Nitrospiraceae bacterium]|nr:nucleotidyltransferase domain-containing protein [Nitrospiraceae bacterium]